MSIHTCWLWRYVFRCLTYPSISHFGFRFTKLSKKILFWQARMWIIQQKAWDDGLWLSIYHSTTLNICLNRFTAIKIKQNFQCVAVFFFFLLLQGKGSFKTYDIVTLLHYVQTDKHQSAHYSLRLTRSWYFRYGSSTYQFLLFQKEVVILSKSVLCVLLQNTCSLRRFFLAGFFFHSFFLYPACLHPKQEVRLETPFWMCIRQ